MSDFESIVQRLVSIRGWSHDEAHQARREYDRLADEAAELLAARDRALEALCEATAKEGE